MTAHPRNVDDAEIRAVADKGGVFGVYFMTYLREHGQSLREDVMAHRARHAGGRRGSRLDWYRRRTSGRSSLDDAFREYWRVEVCEPRVRAGIAAPNDGPGHFQLRPRTQHARPVADLPAPI